MKKSNSSLVITRYTTFITLFSFAISFSSTTYVLFLLSRGMNLLQVNLINAFFMFFIVIAEIPTGIFADRFGRHKSIIFSCFLLAAGMLVYYLANSFIFFVIAEIIIALGQTFVSGAAEAWLVDSLKAENALSQKNSAFRKESVSRSAGSIGGCLSGSILGGFNLGFPWLGSILFICLTGLYALLYIKENYHREKEKTNSKNLVKGFGQALSYGLKKKELLTIMMFGAILALSFQALNMQWTVLFKQDYNFSAPELGFLFAGISLISALGGLFSKNLKTWFKNEKLLIFSSQLITALAIIACSCLNGLFLVMSTFLLHEFGRGIFSPLKQSYVNNYIESKNRATILSLESMFSKSGAFIGLMASGLIAEALSIRLTWLFSGIFLSVGIIIFMFNSKKPLTVEAPVK
ncbi:MAG: MFS transporter [Candidatus Falkowbacteria bacterium]